MNCSQAIETDDAIKLAKCFFRSSVAADLVPGGEYVGGVETNAESLRLADVLYNISELLEAMTEA